MIWLRLAPYLTVGLLLAGGVWWVSEQRYDAGYLAGNRAGYLRGVRDTQTLHDKAMLTLLAESRAATEKALRAKEDANRDAERRHEAAIAAARLEYAGLVASRDRVLARLRSAAARDSVRPGDSNSGLPQADPAGTGLTIPGKLLHAEHREFLVDLAADADRINANFAICKVSLNAQP